MLLFFCQFLFLLLMLDVSLYYILIYAHSADKITTRPKMITPIRLLLHLGIGFEQLDRKFTFQYSHQFGYGYPRWNRQYNVNMINLYAHFMNIAFFPLAQKPYIVFNQGFHLTSQYPKSVFGHPYYVVITFINNMRKLFILTHITNIGKPVRTLPPSKTVGF